MRMKKKVLSLLLAFVMLLGLLPAAAFAAEAEEVVYLSVSFDSQYIDDQYGNPIMYVPVPLAEIAAVDLAEYGLDNMWFDADGDGDYETTGLQLIIYAHEQLYGGDWSDVNFSAYPGSSYFAGGIFGFTENLVYFHNGDFPVDESQTSEYYTVGATSDRIVLEAGDFLDVASFGCYGFLWDPLGGFHLFADENDNYTHDYTVKAGETLNVKLKHSFCDLMSGTAYVNDAADFEVFYGAVYGEAEGSVITDEEGCAEITFDAPGTYSIWSFGGHGDESTHGGCDYYWETGEPCIVSSPAFAKVTVTGEEKPEDPKPEDPKPEERDTETALKVTAEEGITLSANATFCDDCMEDVYSVSGVSAIDTTISWACTGHGETPDTDCCFIGVNAFPAEGYFITGVTVNGTKYDIDGKDDQYDTLYLDEYSYIAENTNCVSIALIGLENTAPEDLEIHVHAEKKPEDPKPEDPKPEDPKPEEPRQPQSVKAVLDATMDKLASTVTAPSFGTNAGEWTVFALARGGCFAKDDKYFADYYERIVETVNTEAAKVNMNGTLHKSKSTENSRLIMALSAIGKDATAVGDWDLVEAYSANGINWIKKQGMNGTIWTLIALDSGNYETSDPTIRQQCVDSILSLQHDDGGWSLINNKTLTSNVDITGMTLTALYPYRDQPAVAAACEKAIAWLSQVQLENGGFPYGEGETSESCVWAIVSLTTWGIDPDTDPRFIKNGKSAVDNLLSYYIEEEAMFAHQGTEANGMATDQACYALVAYDRFVNGKAGLYDYSDVVFDGKLENNTAAEENAFTGKLETPVKELADKLLSEDEAKLVAGGTDVSIRLAVEDIGQTVSAADKALVEQNLGKNTVGLYLDITLTKQLGAAAPAKVSQTKGDVTVSIVVPEALRSKDTKVQRTYQVLRVHEGKTDLLDADYDAASGKLSFRTDRFSTYVLVYADTAAAPSGSPQTGDNTAIGVFAAMMAVSAVCMAALVSCGRRKKHA